MGSKPKAPKIEPVIQTIAPRYADQPVQDAGVAARRYAGGAGQAVNILTSGQGDVTTPGTRKKTLLGQ